MDRGAPAPLGRYHGRNCALCGADVYRAGRDGLTLVVIRATHAWGWRCVDNIACVRRRTRRDQLPLFDARAV